MLPCQCLTFPRSWTFGYGPCFSQCHDPQWAMGRRFKICRPLLRQLLWDRIAMRFHLPKSPLLPPKRSSAEGLFCSPAQRQRKSAAPATPPEMGTGTHTQGFQSQRRVLWFSVSLSLSLAHLHVRIVYIDHISCIMYQSVTWKCEAADGSGIWQGTAEKERQNMPSQQGCYRPL